MLILSCDRTRKNMEIKDSPPKIPFATYQVGLKILLKKEDKFLFLIDSSTGFLDLPGGRIDEIEHETQLTEIIAREVNEELGENIKYKLGKPIFQFRR